MYIAYYRVSTQRQGQSGLGLEAQQSAVKKFVGVNPLLSEFVEIESGTKADRPQLRKALAMAKSHKAILVIAKLDRLARNVHFISGLLESGVQFIAVDMPEADRTFLQMAAVFAEWEARKISERTKAALQAAKDRGITLGSPRIENALTASIARNNAMFNDWLQANKKKVMRYGMADGTLRQVADDLMSNGVPTISGNRTWTPQQVKNLRRRITCLN